MMKKSKKWYVWYSAKDNMVYINSEELTPDCSGMSFKERRDAFNEAYKLSYAERLEKFGSDVAKAYVKEELEAHKGCGISEFLIPILPL